MYRIMARYLIIATLAACAAGGLAEGDALAGKRLFETQCAGCHSVTADTKLAGPNLVGLIGRRAGSVEGLASSAALKKSDFKWSEDLLNDYLANPSQTVPGTSKTMAVRDEKQRTELIAYLKTLK